MRNRLSNLLAVSAGILIVAADGGPAYPQAAGGPRGVLTSSGAIIPLPPIDKMDCPTMQRTLQRIDLSEYRDSELVDSDHPDYEIFVYEDRLHESYYERCLATAPLPDSSNTFSHGFRK